MITEYEEGTSNWEGVYEPFWLIALENLDLVLDIPLYKLEVLSWGRVLSMDWLVTNEEVPKLMLISYFELIKFVATLAGPVTEEDFGKLFDQHLNQHSERMGMLYIPVKLNALNMIHSESFETQFIKQENKELEEAAELFDSVPSWQIQQYFGHQGCTLKTSLELVYETTPNPDIKGKVSTLQILQWINGSVHPTEDFTVVDWSLFTSDQETEHETGPTPLYSSPPNNQPLKRMVI